MLLQEDKYDAVCKALNEDVIVWQKRGPANKRSVDVVALSIMYFIRDDNFPFLNGFPFLYRPFGSILRFAQIR